MAPPVMETIPPFRRRHCRLLLHYPRFRQRLERLCILSVPQLLLPPFHPLFHGNPLLPRCWIRLQEFMCARFAMEQVVSPSFACLVLPLLFPAIFPRTREHSLPSENGRRILISQSIGNMVSVEKQGCSSIFHLTQLPD